MAEPVIVTVHYTPPGAPDTGTLHLELHADPGARLTVHLGTRHATPPVPTQPEPPDWEDLSGRPEPRFKGQDEADLSGIFDWDLADLPADCAPGRKPELLTGAQAVARIRYGYEQGWSQRRIASFAGRSPSTAHKYVERFRAERKSETRM
ncbi:hypothetical protein GCM10010524_50190 [Streptomyces mexicanus]